MVKLVRKRRKKKTDAWKNLRKAAAKGPKRVRMHAQRIKNGVDPLTEAKFRRLIQIVNPKGKEFVVVITLSSFCKMQICKKKCYKMPLNRLTKNGEMFADILEKVSYIDFASNPQTELQMKQPLGRCIVFAGHIGTPDATFRINQRELSEEEQSRAEKNRKYIEALYKGFPIPGRHVHSFGPPDIDRASGKATKTCSCGFTRKFEII